MDAYYGQQARFVILVCGRLGLRRGELGHMRESWIDWRNSMISIPYHQPCDKGRDGGICGYCTRLAQMQADHAPERTIDDRRRRMWSPKTQAAAREVPFDANERAAIALERFFDRFDRWPCSVQAVNRRVDKAAALAGLDVYPHALRATAASYHASRDISVHSLMSIMGWADPSTARAYVTANADQAAKEIRSKRR